ncbi:metallophosphoesterase [Pseudovibrio sp. SPO723]|uniref:metallophosphoesterase n=1 Tax=Nesiotobacter zosterae TaxID=392721 RepID=UPI0029C42754|nr:metallophosphoesterase [Pseudovibrio sp. SPO723]MDX5592590.1 metallophosphoesterase [Pseudovibrio sp. SPO723]
MTRPSDADIIAAYDKVGTKQGACKYLRAQGFEIPRTTFRRRLNRLSPNGGNPPAGMETRSVTVSEDAQGNVRGRSIKYAEERPQDFEPDTGLAVKGRSTLVDGEGRVIQEWIKEDRKRLDPEFIAREIIDAFKADLPRAAAVEPPRPGDSDLCATYVLTDYHLGMLADEDETRVADWDMDKAEDLIVKWFGAAIDQAPAANTAVLAQLGDFLHWDGLAAVTPTSGHLLDADTRWHKLVRRALSIVRRIVQAMLEKHGQVRLVWVSGNHDMSSSVMMREFLSVLYEHEPRISVDTTADLFHAFEFGNTSLFFHHGHRRGVNQIAQTMAAKFRDIYGRTKYSYAHIGHFHHKDQIKAKEDSLMEVEQHQTLAPADAHSATSGYLSKRSAQVITYHREYGETGRLTIRPEMVL